MLTTGKALRQKAGDKKDVYRVLRSNSDRAVQREAEEAKARAEARLLDIERVARRKHEELDSRAARLEAQLHQQVLDTNDYRRRSEADSRRQQQLLEMAAQARRYLLMLTYPERTLVCMRGGHKPVNAALMSYEMSTLHNCKLRCITSFDLGMNIPGRFKIFRGGLCLCVLASMRHSGADAD